MSGRGDLNRLRRAAAPLPPPPKSLLQSPPPSRPLTRPPLLFPQSHILLKHTGSRNPTSRRTNEPVTLTPEEARAELQDILDFLKQKGPAEFQAMAAKRSDCSSCNSGGDLGAFERGMMQKPFEDASFELEVGGMTQEIVETDSGSHIIMRFA